MEIFFPDTFHRDLAILEAVKCIIVFLVFDEVFVHSMNCSLSLPVSKVHKTNITGTFRRESLYFNVYLDHRSLSSRNFYGINTYT